MWKLLENFVTAKNAQSLQLFKNVIAKGKDINGGRHHWKSTVAGGQSSNQAFRPYRHYLQSWSTVLKPTVLNKPVLFIRAPVTGHGTKNSGILISQRCLRTSPRRDALPPVVVLVLGRLAKVGAMIFGRTVRRWWQKLPPEEKAAYAGRVRRNRYIISGILGATAFGSFVYYESHIQETPYCERKRFLAFTNAQIYEMAKLELEALLQLNEKQIIPANSGAAVYRRVVKVAQQLLNANQHLPQIHGLEWTVTVVNDDKEMNAFVLPCGSIFVYSGLLKLCDSDDQLGIILGHEMAHAVMGHSAEKASFMHFLDLMFIIPLAALWAFIPTDVAAAIVHWITAKLADILMELPYSRFIEEEADLVGLILAARACFDIREAPVVWAKMGMMDNTEAPIEWLSTHPSHEKRQAQLNAYIPEVLPTRESCQCPMLPPVDPRLKIKAIENLYQQKRNNLAVPLKVGAKV